MLTENEIWNKETMRNISSDVVKAEQDSYQTINVSANKGTKPLHKNSIVKGLLVFAMASIVGAVIFLVFSSGGSKKSIANFQTEKAPEIAQEDKGGWKIAAEQGTANGMGVDVDDANPSDKKSDVAKAETTDKPKGEAAKTAPASSTTTPAAGTASATTAAKAPVVPASPPIAPAPKPASVVYSPPKAAPIPSKPSGVDRSASLNQDQSRKIEQQAAKIKELESKVAKPPIAVANASTPQKPVDKPAPIASPAPKAIATPVVASAPIAPLAPKAIAKPESKPATPPVVVASNPAPAAAPISWEQASAAGVYGGDPADSAIPQPVGGLGVKDGGKDAPKQQQTQRQQSNYEGAMSPTLLLAAGTNVKGHTLAPYTVGISKDQSDAVPLSIALDEPIELDKGYRLPKGTNINFVASVRDNGSVVAVSKSADIGGVEIQLPEGAISLASDNNGLLMAKEISTGDGDLARADMNSSIWGGVAGAGRAILQSGSTTQTNNGLLGTTTTQTNSGSPNVLGGVLQGAFDPLAANGQRRAEQTADRIEQRSKLHTIDVNTKVKLFVNASIQVQIPVSGQQVGQVAEEQEELPPPPRLITSNSVPSATENELPPQQMSVAPQSATQTPAVVAPAQPVAVPPQLPQTPVAVPKQSLTTTPSLNPQKTRTSTTW
jgi:hypothetical protein